MWSVVSSKRKSDKRIRFPIKFANITAQDPNLETQGEKKITFCAFPNQCSPSQSTVWYIKQRNWNPLFLDNHKNFFDNSHELLFQPFTQMAFGLVLFSCLYPSCFPPEHCFCSTLGELLEEIILASFVTALPKTWVRISHINSPKGNSDRGQRSQTGGHGCFIP